jgi:hypothetical protein
MNQLFAVFFLSLGIFLLVLGVNAYDSPNSEVSVFFTDSSSTKSFRYLIAGMLICIVGLYGLFRGHQKH